MNEKRIEEVRESANSGKYYFLPMTKEVHKETVQMQEDIIFLLNEIDRLNDEIGNLYLDYDGPGQELDDLKNFEQSQCAKLLAENRRLETELEKYKRVKNYWDDLYGEGLEIANWHLNGDTEPFDSFWESAENEFNAHKESEGSKRIDWRGKGEGYNAMEGL